MFKSKRQWDSVKGHNDTRWGSEVSGIPTEIPLWHTQVADGLSMRHVAIKDGILYAISNNSNIHAIDASLGETLWVYPNADDKSNLSTIHIGDDFLVVDHLILNVTNGSLIEDLRDIYNSPILQIGESAAIVGQELIRAWDTDTKPWSCIIYSVETQQSKEIIRSVIGVFFSSDGKISVGWKDMEDESDLVANSYPSSKELWKFHDTDPGLIKILNNSLILLGQHEIKSLNINNGDVKWTKQYANISNSINPSLIFHDQMICSGDSIHFFHDNILTTLSLENGKKLWGKKFFELTCGCVAGDLLFCIQERHEAVALDKYSGESVWSIPASFPWTSVISCDDKIIFVGSSGDIACYQWKDEYHSPHKAN